MARYLVTGGAGFIGSALVRMLVRDEAGAVTVLDKLTYAGSMDSLSDVAGAAGFDFLRADICDPIAVAGAFERADPDVVFHLAAETHVDRSIEGPAAFIETNVRGTYELLEAARRHRGGISGERADAFRFVQVSTDEVFGALGETGTFTEETPFDPSSPYSASKAAADHLASAWHRTYGLPVITTHCSNNYGPFQFPEKLIPLMVANALAGRPLPVYGDGRNVRDWLHVDDHARGLIAASARGAPGRTYNFGGHAERSNIDLVQTICAHLDERRPGSAPHADLINFVTDRPGHDFRYAVSTDRATAELGWRPVIDFDEGIADAVDWVLENGAWCQSRLDAVIRARADT